MQTTMLEFLASEFPFVGGDYQQAMRVIVRLAIAALLSGVIGWERGRRGHVAGLRTHMLVGLGAAMFTFVPTLYANGQTDLAQVVKGVAAGIGFLGAGTILKNQEKQQIEGLTTAASIWLTAAVGMAVGAGFHFAAALSVVLAWMVLVPVKRIEEHFDMGDDANQPPRP
jgi:putative Mg2+ transporter-C (MgtC) family protein